MDMTPDRRPFSDLINGFERLVLASCAILFFSACADGYPTEDELTINPVEMNQVERLEAMNRLGQEAHPEFTWLYRAMPGCSLQWTVHGTDSGKKAFNLPLWGAGVDVSFNKADKIYSVQARPADVSELEETPVLLSKKWVDAIEMSQLVRLFQVGCKASSATVPPDSSGQS